MTKLYATRGTGVFAGTVYISPLYKHTILTVDFNSSSNWSVDWSEQDEILLLRACYLGFKKVTGITLEPGYYTTIGVSELQ